MYVEKWKWSYFVFWLICDISMLLLTWKENDKNSGAHFDDTYQNLNAYSISLNLSQANLVIEQIHTQMQKDIHRSFIKTEH